MKYGIIEYNADFGGNKTRDTRPPRYTLFMTMEELEEMWAEIESKAEKKDRRYKIANKFNVMV